MGLNLTGIGQYSNPSSSFGMDSNTFSGTNDSGSSSSSGGRNKFREALMAASKYKSETDYKAEKESEEKEKRAAQRNTMKISDDASVMEGYTDPGFTLQGQKGRSILGTVGAVVTPFAPLTGQAIGAVGNLTGY